ncbi:MAG: AAA family ATPase, partial [Bacteroidota bacterium]
MNYNSDVEAVNALVVKYNQLKNEIQQVIVGQDEVIKNLLISIFCKGHCLLVGVPGLAKTLMVNTLSRV